LSVKPVDVFRAVVNFLTETSSFFSPNSLYGVTAQMAAYDALCEMEKVDPANFRFLVSLMTASRCTKSSLTVLTGVKDCRAVIQSAAPDDKKLFDGFVATAIELVSADYLGKSNAWHNAQRDKLSSAAAAAAATATTVPDSVAPRKRARAAPAPAPAAAAAAAAAETSDGAQSSGADMGSDPNAALHTHCIASYQTILDAHAKITDEVVQITAERDKLKVTLSVKDDQLKKLQADVAALRAIVPGASSSAAAIASSKAVSLERQLKAVNELATRLIREFNTIAGMTAVNPT